jgi:hypothetical protein
VSHTRHMLVGVLGTLDEHRFTWAACFAGSALLAWILLRHWRGLSPLPELSLRLPTRHAWRGRSPSEVAALCERRIGLPVDAAAPAHVGTGARSRCVLALAGDGLWVLADESRLRHRQIGRVLACWDRTSLVAHVTHSRRWERIELSWPRNGALIRGVMPPGTPADLLAGHLVADELAIRS